MYRNYFCWQFRLTRIRTGVRKLIRFSDFWVSCIYRMKVWFYSSRWRTSYCSSWIENLMYLSCICVYVINALRLFPFCRFSNSIFACWWNTLCVSYLKLLCSCWIILAKSMLLRHLLISRHLKSSWLINRT